MTEHSADAGEVFASNHLIDTSVGQRRSWPTWSGVALWCLALASVFVIFIHASIHTFAGNSDGATVVLEGHAIAHGNLLLHGWSISLDSFWSVDSLFYAVGVLVAGLRSGLLHVVPALIASLVVFVGMRLARDGQRGPASVAGAVTVLVILGLPSVDLSYFFLQGPWHVGTALYCLIAFAAFSRAKFGWIWLLGVVAFALGILGDFVTMTIGVVPALVAGIVAAVRLRSIRRGTTTLLGCVASIGLALTIRLIIQTIGTFTIANRNLVVRSPQVVENLHKAWGRLAGLFGVGSIPNAGHNGNQFVQIVHLISLFIVIVAVVLALVHLVRGVIAGANNQAVPTIRWHLDDLLLIAIAGDISTYVLFSPTGNGNYVRYLTPGALFAAVLAGRLVARLCAHLRNRAHIMPMVAISAVVVAVYAFGTSEIVSSAAPVQPTLAVEQFLTARDLTLGLGDYWSSSIVTVESSGKIKVRPISADRKGKITRYDRQSASSWYDGQQFQFVVFDIGMPPVHHITTATTTAFFGPATTTYVIGTYRVLVWGHPLHVSGELPPQPNPLQLFIKG